MANEMPVTIAADHRGHGRAMIIEGRFTKITGTRIQPAEGARWRSFTPWHAASSAVERKPGGRDNYIDRAAALIVISGG